MNAKSDEAIFMGYALNSKTYRVFNKTSLIVEESIHVVFYKTNAAPRKGVIANDDVDFEDHIVEEPKEKNQGDRKENPPVDAPFCPGYLFPFHICWTLGLELISLFY